MLLQPLPWDSDFLGFPVANVQNADWSNAGLTDLLLRARAQGYRLLYCFVAPGAVAAAALQECPQAVLADRKVRLRLPVLPGQPTRLPASIRPTRTYSPALRALAPQAGTYSRFQQDPHFAPTVCPRLYELWLGQALRGESGQEVLLYQPASSPVPLGFLTLREKNQRTAMELMAVEAASRGQGIGAAFIEAARCRAAAAGHTAVQLVTQATNPACRLYHREGFVLEHEELVYHVWL
ncbi:GNAT family N-acetyltransferase [Hymenobacter sp. NST-14]|uniref:GNAT family N-acetyltransferase n=1 Tax=Hymenobacter piscis TaxID=2839984 RepID=UPI001C01D7B4|nr:GNAT family N-acetyltransferase [Hymenobacter piscis]MBT9391842.1 GNAT family N-acetyltransferase [Hymenobacter piscis]